MKNIVVIVDPASTGRFYAPLFHKQGYDCVAVISKKDLPKHFTVDIIEENFIQIVQNDVDGLALLDKLENVVAVIAGCETAIHVADQLAERLKVNGNPAASSDRRRNKFVMQNALREHGLPYIPSLIIENSNEIPNSEEIQAFFSDVATQDGYVVKPINSAATDGVVFVPNLDGVKQALSNAKWNQVNDLGEINRGFIVQPFITGPEYVVDMVAFGDHYSLASICKYKKIARNGGQFVYESLDLVSPDAPEMAAMVAYAREAAKALEISVGPIHMEIIDSSQGPVMIEAGARLHGGIAPELFRTAYQPDLLTLAVHSYLNDGDGGQPEDAKLIKFGRIGFFFSDAVSEFKKPDSEMMAAATSDPSYCGCKYFFGEGDILPVTIDFATCPGLFWMTNSDPQQLQASEQRLRALLWRQS